MPSRAKARSLSPELGGTKDSGSHRRVKSDGDAPNSVENEAPVVLETAFEGERSASPPRQKRAADDDEPDSDEPRSPKRARSLSPHDNDEDRELGTPSPPPESLLSLFGEDGDDGDEGDDGNGAMVAADPDALFNEQIRREMWLEELETIQRPVPLLDGDVEQVSILKPCRQAWNASTVTTPPPPQGWQGDNSDGEGSSKKPITLDSDSDADAVGEDDDTEYLAVVSSSPSSRGSGRSSPIRKQETLRFYGGKDITEGMVRFQDRTTHQGQIPGPLTSDRLDRAKMRDELSLRVEAKALKHPARAALHSQWAVDAEQSFLTEWTPARSAPLLWGFPLVEEVVFLRADNWVDQSNCYWNAISLHIYGSVKFAARVKSEHLEHVRAVLSNEAHPLHARYAVMNSRFYRTTVMPYRKGGDDAKVAGTPVVLNLWQMLNFPNSWTPAAMLDVTADLYGVFLILYTLSSQGAGAEKVVTEVKTKGRYNARHLFMLFVNGCHYQPMTPNEHIGWEFQCPRVTRWSTAGCPQAPRLDGSCGNDRDGVGHPWRREFGRAVAAPLPVNYLFEAKNLRKVVGEKA